MNFLHELVPLLTPFVPLATALVWPVTILIILWWFKDRLRELIKNIAEAKVGEKLYFKFWQAKTDIASVETVTVSLPEVTTAPAQLNATDGARWDRVADVFWLGSDLDWTIQTALRGAPKERIIHGLTQSAHHASQIGLADTVPGRNLSALLAQVSKIPEENLDREWRSHFEVHVSVMMRQFSNLAQERQPDFRPSPFEAVAVLSAKATRP